MGKVNHLHIGTAVTIAEAEDFKPSAMGIDDRIAKIVENKWKDITINKLLALVDQVESIILMIGKFPDGF